MTDVEVNPAVSRVMVALGLPPGTTPAKDAPVGGGTPPSDRVAAEAQTASGGQRQPDLTKVCPRCAETIKSAAVVCRFCGHEFEQPAGASSAARFEYHQTRHDQVRRARYYTEPATSHGVVSNRVWSVISVIFAVLSIFFFPVFFGPIAIVCGIVGVVRGERRAKYALAAAVVCMIVGFIFGAIVGAHEAQQQVYYYYQ